MCLKWCLLAAVLVGIAADWVEVSVIKPDVKTEAITHSQSTRVKSVTVVKPHAGGIPLADTSYADLVENLPKVGYTTIPPPLKPWSTDAPRHDASKPHLSRPKLNSHTSILATSSVSGVLQETTTPTPPTTPPPPPPPPPPPSTTTTMKDVPSPGLDLPESPLEAFQNVHKILLMEKQATVGTKMDFLQNLQNSMLQQIERSIKGLWGVKRQSRQARTGKMGFPSMESALLSLSFLVFAVFLIKLVQQLFQSFGNQNTNTAMIVPPQQGQQPLTVGRRRRSLEDINTTARILQLMDDFQIKLKSR